MNILDISNEILRINAKIAAMKNPALIKKKTIERLLTLEIAATILVSNKKKMNISIEKCTSDAMALIETMEK